MPQDLQNHSKHKFLKMRANVRDEMRECCVYMTGGCFCLQELAGCSLGGSPVPKACGRPSIRMGANLLAPKLSHRLTEVSARIEVNCKMVGAPLKKEICIGNGGCGGFCWWWCPPSVCMTRWRRPCCRRYPTSPSPPPQFDTKPRWRGAAMDKLTSFSPF